MRPLNGFAAILLILSITLLSACGPRTTGNAPKTALYPVTSVFSWGQRVSWCSTMGLDMSDPTQDQPCTNLFLSEVRYRLVQYYGVPWAVWNICAGNPAVCDDPERMEDHAREYHI